MRFAIVGEGLTDFKVLKNLLIGFFKDKNLPVTRLLPNDNEPVGWGNVLQYLSTAEFQMGVRLNDYVVVQIDTNECEEWAKVRHLGDNSKDIIAFIGQITAQLIARISHDFYHANQQKIFFAICVHEIECWLLPFHASQPAHASKLVGCFNTLEKIAVKNGYSLHQKNYQDGKHYDGLSGEMKNHKELLKKSELNPGMKVFIDTLLVRFPQDAQSH